MPSVIDGGSYVHWPVSLLLLGGPGGSLEIYRMMSGLVYEYKLHLVMIQLVTLSVPFQKMNFFSS